jgi:hypothetical protein
MSTTPHQQSAPQPDPQLRLALSRKHLSLALHQLRAEQIQAAAQHSAHPAWWDALRAEPGTRLLLDTLTAWWVQQPWHQTTALLAASAKQLLRPLAQRKPVALVLAATALGAVLVLLKPWRWISVPALAAGLLPPLMVKLFHQLQPLSWVQVLNSWLQARSQAEPPP